MYTSPPPPLSHTLEHLRVFVSNLLKGHFEVSLVNVALSWKLETIIFYARIYWNGTFRKRTETSNASDGSDVASTCKLRIAIYKHCHI